MASTLKVNNIQHSGGTAALNIDSTGRVTKPSLPFFCLTGNSENNKSMENGDRIGATDDGNTALISSGGSGIAGIRGFTYNSATGEVNVPIDGVYILGCNIFSNATETLLIAIYRGNTIISYVQQDNVGTCNNSIVAVLTANDKITFRNVSGATKTIYEGTAHTQIYGYLLG